MDKEYIERDMALSHKWEVRVYDPSDPDPVTEVVSVSSIMCIPAADVVEVVRCRECRYAPSGTDDGAEQGFGLEWPEDKPYHTNPCPFNIEDGWYSHKPKPDFFCANGKRKDGGQDE